MAVINFLHWNIETLSNNKINNGNGPHIINYIADVAANVNANMISIIEVKTSAAANLAAVLIPALQAAKNNGNPWIGIASPNTPNAEAYFLLWETNNNFTTLPSSAVGGPDPNREFTVANANPPPVNLPFPSPATLAGGRKPYGATFQTTDTNHNFSVLMYHAMFGGLTAGGVRNMGRLQAINSVDDGTGAFDIMDATIVAGDFNIDIIQLPAEYANLIAAVGQPAIDPANFMNPDAAKTSLVNSTPPVPYNNPLDYRVHAYDNIFGRNAPYANAAITDLIYDSAVIGGMAGPLSAAITNFAVAHIRNNALLNNAPPPQDFEDSWHIVRDQISNHLPVSVSLTI